MFKNKSAVSEKIMNRFFRRVDNVVWDLMSGTTGVRTDEGIITFVPADGEEEAAVSMNMFDDFGVEIPAFAQNTPVSALDIGDLICGSKTILGWITEKKEKSFTLLKPDGMRSTWSPMKIQTLGFDSGGAMVLRSLMTTLGGEGKLGGFQSALMPLLMMDGEFGGGMMGDMESILPMMLFSQMNGADGAGAMNNMMMPMMMMKMMKGGGGGNSSSGNHFD